MFPVSFHKTGCKTAFMCKRSCHLNAILWLLYFRCDTCIQSASSGPYVYVSFMEPWAEQAFTKHLHGWRRAEVCIVQKDSGVRNKCSSESVIVSMCVLVRMLRGNSYHRKIRKPHSVRFPPSFPFIVGKNRSSYCCHWMKEWANPQRFVFQLNETYSLKSKGVLKFYSACVICFLTFFSSYC